MDIGTTSTSNCYCLDSMTLRSKSWRKMTEGYPANRKSGRTIKNAKRSDFSEFQSFYVQKIDWLTRKSLHYLQKKVKLRWNWNKISIFAVEKKFCL